jgi:hypothetical protein
MEVKLPVEVTFSVCFIFVLIGQELLPAAGRVMVKILLRKEILRKVGIIQECQEERSRNVGFRIQQTPLSRKHVFKFFVSCVKKI